MDKKEIFGLFILIMIVTSLIYFTKDSKKIRIFNKNVNYIRQKMPPTLVKAPH